MDICGRGWVCVEPVKDTVVHSAGPELPLMEKTLKPARELSLVDIVHPLMDIVHCREEKVEPHSGISKTKNPHIQCGAHLLFPWVKCCVFGYQGRRALSLGRFWKVSDAILKFEDSC